MAEACVISPETMNKAGFFVLRSRNLIMKTTDLSNRAAEFVLQCTDKELGSLSVAKLARIFTISESFLSRKFKQSKQCTIGKYIFRERMFRAATLIREHRNTTIKSLSEIIGFDDYEYFMRAFKSFYGVSPSQYRNCKKTIYKK